MGFAPLGHGGLFKRSTWLNPVATAANLPVPAPNGAAAIALDTHTPYEFNAGLGVWTPFPSSGPTGSTNIFRWAVGTDWSVVYAAMQANGGFGIILVDPDAVPRVMTTGTYDLTDTFFIGTTLTTTSVRVDLEEGVQLTNGVLRSKNVLWRSLATATPIVSPATGGLLLDLSGGGFIAWSDPTAIAPIQADAGFNQITLRDGATLDGTGWAGTPETFFTLGAGSTAQVTMTTGSSLGPLVFSSGAAANLTVARDASSTVAVNFFRPTIVLATALLDAAKRVFYDDTIVNPPLLGASDAQAAIDALKLRVAALESRNVRQVTLIFAGVDVPPGTVINIQTGVYAGGGPATVEGDTATLLPGSGVTFVNEGDAQVALNGSTLRKGTALSPRVVQWVSPTEISLSVPLHDGDVLAAWSPSEIGSGGDRDNIFVYAEFGFATASPLDVGVLMPGDVIENADILIEVPFDDPAATLTLGLASDPASILPASGIDPQHAGTYNNGADFPITVADAIRLEIVRGASTQGVGRVIVTVRRA